MKKLLFLLLTSSIAFFSCQSKEEKAAELIKSELSKTLYDFESYQPMETTVKEAKASIYNDSTCWAIGGALAYSTKQVLEYIDEMTDAKEHMDIWGRPTYYSSSYSDNKYYKYKEEYTEAKNKTIKGLLICKNVISALKDSIAKIDTTQVIGWEVIHRFRCKSKGGYASIGEYRYIIDKDFEKVLLCEDKDGEIDKKRREALEAINADFWENIDKTIKSLSQSEI